MVAAEIVDLSKMNPINILTICLDQLTIAIFQSSVICDIGNWVLDASTDGCIETRYFIVKSFNEENVLKCIDDVSYPQSHFHEATDHRIVYLDNPSPERRALQGSLRDL